MQVQPLFANYLEPQIPVPLPNDTAASKPSSLATGRGSLLDGLAPLPENMIVTTMAYPSDSDCGRINPLLPRPGFRPRPPCCGGIDTSHLIEMIMRLLALLRMRGRDAGRCYNGCNDDRGQWVFANSNVDHSAPTVTGRVDSQMAATDASAPHSMIANLGRSA